MTKFRMAYELRWDVAVLLFCLALAMTFLERTKTSTKQAPSIEAVMEGEPKQ